MNLILLEDVDFIADDRVRLAGRRLAHVRAVHRARLGDRLRVGRVGGPLGEGTITRLDDDALELDVTLDRPAPPPSQVELVVALPRPPSLRKLLQQGTALGVKRFTLLASRRVEKSYWQSHLLAAGALAEQLRLGLEQGVDTVLPTIEFERRFRPFVEDRLPERLAASRGLLADPDADVPCPTDLAEPVTLVVGPEGGFIPFEVDLLRAAGLSPVGLGPRVLRVETAVVALLARLSP